ncbi:MAG TPA: KamA family radical SAM protein [Persephonella sp.]|uniref:L-lysine 2,3-aminomutase (KAM) (LAM) n=1 Tax=Persephonella marina (strain DSM 14350 / EX-H1) TaxID=123214 RepID=C0QTX4_PERMH|nr:MULTISPECIES: KamA family radical SAM protein [Persephonella]ACO04656.1 L-lysine 2,3-aminomutase (KAM) (LAM) [Persephonella marina EX-H1]HCB70244.1 KamA family radical SAM protein [Persephonella sp.]
MNFLPERYWQRFDLWKDIDENLWNNWKWQLKNRIKSIQELEKVFSIDKKKKEIFQKVSPVFHFGTTPYYISLVKKPDYTDPVFRQIFPSFEEIDPDIQNNGSNDPFNEERSPVEGITHRYPDRVLFRVTTFCSVYCRHCMRKRNFIYGERAKSKKDIDIMIEYIRKNRSIREVLISGGDPLTLPNKKLDYILGRLQGIKHVDIIRIGSREPVVNPFRFYDENLLELFERYDKLWIVTHFNHPNEITQETKKAVKNILSTGTPVLNQTVLLKGINDDKYIIEELMRSLLRVKIKPYYLFFCDPTKGVLHFRTDIKKGIEIMEYLRGRLSGLGIPTYAVDLPEGKGKVPLLPEYIVEINDKSTVFRNYEGEIVKTDIKWG